MVSILSSNYLSRKPVERAMESFGKRFKKEERVLDIGCGHKPYAHFFKCEYIGVDPFPDSKPDVVCNAWDTGFPDNSFNGVILNQSLEHIPRTEDTVKEILRVLKPGGIVLVTVPLAMRHHTTPQKSTDAPIQNFDTKQIPFWVEDYYRFTKFGLIYQFREFEIQQLYPNQSYLMSLVQLWNYFLASFGLGQLLIPFYFVNNILALLLHSLSGILAHFSTRYRALIHEGLTIDHTLIAKKKS